MDRTHEATLSVIVPIFNVEEYLPECLTSIQQQSMFSELQVILVNDGSSDLSPDIARKFADEHENVVYITQDNRGLGAARNAGLDVASARLVTFIDSDDRVPETAYNDLVLGMANPEVNVAVGRLASFPIARTFIWDTAFNLGTRTVSGVCEQPALIHSASACNKVFRMDESGFGSRRFPEGVHFEDAPVVLPILVESPRIFLAASVVYEYRKREVGGSIMDSVFDKTANYFDYLSLIEALSEYSDGLTSRKKSIVEEFIIRGVQGFVKRAGAKLPEMELRDFYLRAYKVLSKVDLGVIERASSDASLRLGFADLLARGEKGFPAEPDKRAQIQLVGEAGYDGYESGRKDNNLRRASRIVFTVEAISPRGPASVVVEGRVHFRGLSADVRPDARIGLSLGNRRFRGRWVSRADRATSGGSWSGFEVVVPVGRWPLGEYLPRMWVSSKDGHFEARTMKSLGYFKSRRMFSRGEKTWELSVNHKNQIVVTTRPRIKLGKFRRGVTKVRDIWRDYRKKRPFALERGLMLFSAPFFRRKIWLISERWDTAQDNGAALFKQLGEKKIPGVDVFYTVERNSHAYDEMKPFGKVVSSGSMRHILLILNASVLINSFDVDTYSTPRSWNVQSYTENLLPYLKAKRVFLQHGVAYRNVARGLHRLVQRYDLVITSCEMEWRYFQKTLGYGKRAVLSGLPRFDTLESAGADRVILYAPTWRPYLVSPSYRKDITGPDDSLLMMSSYYLTIVELLNSEHLHLLLNSYNASLRFLPHYELAKHFHPGQFGDIVQVVDQSTSSFQDELNSASMLITDYSSTFFDVAYAGKPIVYLSSDHEDFEAHNPGLDTFLLPKDGFGPWCQTVEEAIASIEVYLDNGFAREQVFTDRVVKSFRYIDKENGNRVISAISNA